MSIRRQMLALLERGHADAQIALEELKAGWIREDQVIHDHRMTILAAHAQGAIDRDAARVRFGGVSKLPKPDGTEEQPAVRTPETADAEAERASGLTARDWSDTENDGPEQARRPLTQGRDLGSHY
jgi:hypothetical protein